MPAPPPKFLQPEMLLPTGPTFLTSPGRTCRLAPCLMGMKLLPLVLLQTCVIDTILDSPHAAKLRWPSASSAVYSASLQSSGMVWPTSVRLTMGRQESALPSLTRQQRRRTVQVPQWLQLRSKRLWRQVEGVQLGREPSWRIDVCEEFDCL